MLEGASRGPIGRLLTDDIQLRFPCEDQRPYALYGLDPSSREYIMRCVYRMIKFFLISRSS